MFSKPRQAMPYQYWAAVAEVVRAVVHEPEGQRYVEWLVSGEETAAATNPSEIHGPFRSYSQL